MSKKVSSNINWYPGHMFKTKRQLEEISSKIDVAVEILDSRIPRSSRNYDLVSMLDRKKSVKRIIVLNKADLADDRENDRWMQELKNKFKEKELDVEIFKVDANSGKGIKELKQAIVKNKKGISTVRTLIFGIPNVGKSTIINKLAGKKTMQTENKPGVTKKLQWLRIDDNISALDSPGMLWPNFEKREVGINLALVDAIRNDMVDNIEIACELMENIFKKEEYKGAFFKRYDLKEEDFEKGKNTVNAYYYLLSVIAERKNMLISGGNPDYNRVANAIIKDFRTNKIDKITLERV